ncbi:MAG TPA: DUF4115 domain-containing protein [Bacillota bacterium]|nr:DUF4115 domain-containing protein [Bacillota bacterium]HQE02823.1 DUF4115 domain-containing protein [Bacillota bacterium]
METLGEQLRKARLARGLSIEDVHDATKIRIAYLAAMEAGKFYELPGEVYARGFLKNVAKVIGLDGDELVSEYDRIRRSLEAEQREMAGRDLEQVRSRRRPGRRNPFIAIGFIIIIAAVILVLWNPFSREEVDINTEPHLEIEETIAPDYDSEVLPVAPYDNSEEDEEKGEEDAFEAVVPDDSSNTHELTIIANDRCWVRVIADGERVFERTMLPGETSTWKAEHELRIKLGNAGGIILKYNGVDLGSPGKPGDVLELSFPLPES